MSYWHLHLDRFHKHIVLSFLWRWYSLNENTLSSTDVSVWSCFSSRFLNVYMGIIILISDKRAITISADCQARSVVFRTRCTRSKRIYLYPVSQIIFRSETSAVIIMKFFIIYSLTQWSSIYAGFDPRWLVIIYYTSCFQLCPFISLSLCLANFKFLKFWWHQRCHLALFCSKISV